MAATTPTALDYTRMTAIARPPDAVFDAVTIPAAITAWWAPVSGDGNEGGELRFDFGWAAPMIVNVLTARRPAIVVWEVLDCPFLPDRNGTTIVLDIAPTDTDRSSSDLFFRHHGLNRQLECYDTCRQGWNFFLPSLRTYLDTSRGHPLGSPADHLRRGQSKETIRR